MQTVEGFLDEALGRVLGTCSALRWPGVDAGVHARRQVVSLRLPAGLDLPSSSFAERPDASREPGPGFRPAPAAFDRAGMPSAGPTGTFLQIGGADSPFCARYSWRVRERAWTWRPCGRSQPLWRDGMTSPPSPLGRVTSFSGATCCAAGGSGGARTVTLWRSRPLPSSATWCGLWWARWSISAPAIGRRGPARLLRGARREEAEISAAGSRSLP